MKKLTYITAIVMAMTASGVFAHHPVGDIVDSETYEMINENLEAADSPHLTMDLDTMGSAGGIDMGNSAMDQASRDQFGPQSNQAGVIVDVDPPVDAASSVDTIDLMENVDNSLAQ